LSALTVQPPGLAIGPGTELPTVRSRPRSRGRGEDASGVVARSRCSAAVAGQCRGAMLARGGVTAAAALTLLRVSMARCPHPAPEGWPSSRRPAALSGGSVRPTTPGAWDAPGVVARWSTLATVRTLASHPASRDVTAADNLVGNSGQLSNHSGAITDAPGCPWMCPSPGVLDPPLMGPSTPPSMGPSGGEGAVGAGHGLFVLVRRSAGQGHGPHGTAR
jgi:hypothetical protein